MIRCLGISLLLIFVTTSCSLKTTEGFRQIAFVDKEISNPYFSNPNLDYVYKAKIEVYKKNFGGILIVKKTGHENYRIVMTTEFGSKLLDFQFDGEDFTKNFVVEDLDRKFILDVLRKDFRVMLNETAAITAAYNSKTNRVYKTESGKDFNFYFFARTSEKLEKIINTTKRKERVEINFKSSNGITAENISIQHNNIQLKINLEKFKEQ